MVRYEAHLPHKKKLRKERDVERIWTEAQSRAIETRNKTLLVSAAAGSGKTAALTERIIRSITDEKESADISKMLIVTFTRAAAAELRQRIFSAISTALAKDPQSKHLNEQLINMSSARICTIDSFYLDIVRSGFDKLDISPSFRTADAAELDVMAKSIMEDAIDAFYERDQKEFSRIAECFVGIRNSAKLSDIFLDLYSKTESYPEGIEFVRISAERSLRESELDLFEGSYGKVIKEDLLSELDYISQSYKEMCQGILEEDSAVSDAYFASFAYDGKFADTLRELVAIKGYEECRSYATGYSPLSLKALSSKHKNERTEQYKNNRTALVKKIRAVIEKSFKLPAQSISHSMRETHRIGMGIYALLCDFEERFNTEKKQKNIASFADIKRLAMRLLIDSNGNPTESARLYAEQFTHIYIDEYQDVDRVQDMIFRAISKPQNRFMVGDIKQSIYSFRGAEPSVFASYRRLFPEIFANAKEAETSDSVSIFMSNNFRCDKTVIDFTNTVCSHIFSACADSIGYTKEDDLVCSKIVEGRQSDEHPVEIDIIVPGEDDDTYGEESGKVLEARHIAMTIRELLENGKKADGSKVLPHDIAVLFRTKKMGEYLYRELLALGISSTNSNDAEYFENPDVLLMLCLLNAIDNPHRDIYLAGILRSPFYRFSLDELIKIRRSQDFSYSLYDALCEYSRGESELSARCASFMGELDELRRISRSLTVDRLIRHIYSSDMFARENLVCSDDGNNLLRLYEYARKFEGSSFKGLYNFIVYINKIIEEGKKIEAPTTAGEAGKVALMTIHQSKGLEFPICFICNTSGRFNTQDIRESLLCHPSLGVAMKISDSTGLARVNTPMREAIITLNEKELAEEEMRILYVALTRAKERLFITASVKKSPEKLLNEARHRHEHHSKHIVLSARSYIEWILSSLDGNISYDHCRLSFIEAKDVKHKPENTELCLPEGNTGKAYSKETEDELYEKLCEKFSFVYPYKQASRLPAKISVSRLLPESESMKNENVTRLFEERGEYIPPSIFKGKREKAPSASERGTATHLFLQFCDFAYCEKHGVRAELSRLIEKRFLPAQSENIIFCDELDAFFKSELYHNLKNAKRIIREQRFNIFLPPSTLSDDEDFLEQTKDEMLAVQGVIDLLYEDADGNIVLCDYKTDRLTPEELASDELLRSKMFDRHAKQLKYYVEAVRRLFSRDCAKVMIYSTHTAKAVEINTDKI